jgi:hypothetical protein
MCYDYPNRQRLVENHLPHNPFLPKSVSFLAGLASSAINNDPGENSDYYQTLVLYH